MTPLEQFTKDCRALCKYCRGEMPRWNPDAVRVEDYGKDRAGIGGMTVYAHLSDKSDFRCVCHANLIRMASPEFSIESNQGVVAV